MHPAQEAASPRPASGSGRDADDPQEWDVIVVGSGFGGSVAALRLVEKGYRVAVLEAGRRFGDSDFPRTSWDLRRYVFAPALGLQGIQRFSLLRDVIVLAGAGVGGGSLVYGNTLYRPHGRAFYDDPQWGHITDWAGELAPHYDTAATMLGVTINPARTPIDTVLETVAEEMGVGPTFAPSQVGVFFGVDGGLPGVTVPDPFFGGAGPPRAGCLQCGACMTGCRYNAKNTLDKNYLYLAEQGGAVVFERTLVRRLRQLPRSGGGWEVFVTATTADPLRRRRSGRTLRARHVVLAAGTWGTQQLLHQGVADRALPHLSPRLGELTRTNSEAICGATRRLRSHDERDFRQGVAITSSMYPDANTHVEACRYGRGAQSIALLSTVMIDGAAPHRRWLAWLRAVGAAPLQLVSNFLGPRSWSQRSIITLVMQTVDNSITIRARRRWFAHGVTLTSTAPRGAPSPRWLPVANDVSRRIAALIDGHPRSSVADIFDVPMTAHFLGGAVIGETPQTGVIDPYHRVHGYPSLHVVDGAAISANLGVNPSLTIAAQAERAFSLWPNLGQADPRPAPGQPYRRMPAVPALRPAVIRFGPQPSVPRVDLDQPAAPAADVQRPEQRGWASGITAWRPRLVPWLATSTSTRSTRRSG
ncbi:cholesterol oxidase [Kineosphaera limosa]|uniref:Cholesterol oxidase n=1 Tax=Kineosphaera limosa NBRC 100340 TaxID=1184609 RepID=K6WMY5_9MICO|nr:GMC family oxidoreductase [Kineosphaera limosa]NYE01430.1 cholesterol oxidase [Kineosphaera limosa]GAB95176.1 putative oxidoreductase [Kineosphaera limosa NBRC 100340]